MQQQPLNFFSFFHSIKTELDNSFLMIDYKKNLIFDILNNVSSIKLILTNEQKPLSSEQDFFNTANNQINKYLQEINNLKIIGESLNKEKNYFLSKSYNHNINLSRQYNKVFIGIFKKDNNQYITIDKRQNIFKNNDLIHISYRLFLEHKINIKEFRNFKRYGKMSDNLRERLNTYTQHILLKIGHKKHRIKTLKNRNSEYIYIAKFRRLIRFKRYHSDIFDIFHNRMIYSEIAKKQGFELDYRNLYSYSKLNH